jgi:hypothetical protein
MVSFVCHFPGPVSWATDITCPGTDTCSSSNSRRFTVDALPTSAPRTTGHRAGFAAASRVICDTRMRGCREVYRM